MANITIYVPDLLAEQVRRSGLPISMTCRKALERALKRAEAQLVPTILADADKKPK